MEMDIVMLIYFNWIDTNPEWPCVLGKGFKCNRRAMLQLPYWVPEKQCREFSAVCPVQGAVSTWTGRGSQEWLLVLRTSPSEPWVEGLMRTWASPSPLHEGPPLSTCLSIPPPQQVLFQGRVQSTEQNLLSRPGVTICCFLVRVIYLLTLNVLFAWLGASLLLPINTANYYSPIGVSLEAEK